MMIKAYRIDAERRLRPSPPEEAARLLEEDPPLWVDVEGADVATRAKWITQLGFHGLTQRLSLEAGDRPGLYQLQSEMVLVLPALTGQAEAPALHHLCLVCHDNLLLTLHDAPIASSERLADIDDADAWLADRSAPALMAAVLIDVSSDMLSCVRALRKTITALEERMHMSPEAVPAESIMRLRSQLLTVVSAVSEALPVVTALAAPDSESNRKGVTGDFLNCAVVNLQAADGQLEWLDGRISDLRARFELHAQEQTNRRLNMLTILSAIFMPVTLMASIWGMNFATMPELSAPYAYPVALIAMAVVAAGMYLFFKRGGWFDK